ncbi:MAG TPA: hypothetical protein VIP98_07495 [Microlunatus sp.]
MTEAKHLYDGDRKGPPRELFDLYGSAISGTTPQAVYSEQVESEDRSVDWSVWAIMGSAVLRITGKEGQKSSGTMGSIPEATIWPLQVQQITLLTDASAPSHGDVPRAEGVNWAAVVTGDDGKQLTINMSHESNRGEGQRQMAADFAIALRDHMIKDQ